LRFKERKAASVERSSSLHHSPKVGHAELRYPNKSAGRKFREAGKHKIYNTWLLLACWLACFLSSQNFPPQLSYHKRGIKFLVFIIIIIFFFSFLLFFPLDPFSASMSSHCTFSSMRMLGQNQVR
jgi:hypothetical protein